MVARLLLGLTIATYALAIAQCVRGGFAGGVFLVSEPLYWPTLTAMIGIANGVTRREGLRPWRLWRASSERDLRALCRSSMARASFRRCFWLNWAGALVLPGYLLLAGAGWPVRAVAAAEVASTVVWRWPALLAARVDEAVGDASA
jgi:hypothetical protein